MYRGTSSGSSFRTWLGVVIFLLIGVGSLIGYANMQADIQQRQQQMDNGTVTCGGQQMQEGDACNHYLQTNSSSSDSGLYDGSSTYDGQRQENQQVIDKEKNSANSALLIGLLFTGLGIFGLWRCIKSSRNNS